MKKIAFMLNLFLLSTVSLAGTLSVSIKNAGSTDCVLKQQFVLNGQVFHHTQIPDVIFRDQTATFMMSGKNRRTLLVYDCGDEKEVALYSVAAEHGFYGSVITVKNMKAQVTTERGAFFSYNDPAKMHWILTD